MTPDFAAAQLAEARQMLEDVRAELQNRALLPTWERKIRAFLSYAAPSPETGTAAGPTCETCKDAGEVLYMYARGPGDFPGNQMIPCPTCRPAPGATPWSPHGHEAKATAWGGGASGGPGYQTPGPAPEPVKPPAHPLFPDPRTVCKPCDGTGRDTSVPANGWDVACSACNGTGRTPAAGTAPTPCLPPGCDERGTFHCEAHSPAPAPEPVKPPETELCRQCSGAKVIGWGAGQPCFACNGTGRIPAAGTAPKGAE